MKQYFRMFAAYNQWANARLYDAAAELTEEEFERDTGAFFGSVMRTLNHLLVADRIWMKRFTGSGEAPATLDTILHPQLHKLKNARILEDTRMIDWIDATDDQVLTSGRFNYMTVTDMRTVSQRIAPALFHVFNHQTHHRGQVHAILTTLGKASLTLDLVYFQRTEAGRRFA